MFTFIYPNSLRRIFARGAFVLAAFLCLSVAFLFTSCDSDPDSGFVLQGTWASEWDSYIITSTTVHYDMFGNELKGTIAELVQFTDNAGVLIIEVTDVTGFIGNQIGWFTGVYYKDGTKDSIKMGTAMEAIGDDYFPVEAATLPAARLLFTVDNAETHIEMWGAYTK